MLEDVDHTKLAAAGATAGAALVGLVYNWTANSVPKRVQEEKYQGSESYADPPKVQTGLLDDLKAMGGLKKIAANVQTLLELAKNKGKPDDDKKMLMERIIALTASLPETSKTRAKLTDTIIDGLWDSLQHPPLSYMGNKFQYRQPDGSYNNVLTPDLGKAGTPYAKSCRTEKKMHAVKPDPGLLFDLLMSREEGTFKENPAGISSMLFYHATIIIHDIFRTNRADANISDTSSYLDLAPLYGSSLEEQMKVRTKSRGFLKPDTFSEKRLLAQPPGVNVMLVMYNRFHNYCADILYKINEGNKFPAPDDSFTEEERTAHEKKLDEDLFQTARLVTGGLYINICLHDYLRGLTNAHHSDTTWTLDPRIAIDKHFDGNGVPRGVGNQVSAEFNLLYRFHSVISKRDEKWLNDFLKEAVFKDNTKPLEQLTPIELITGLYKYESTIPTEPSEREFAHLKRNEKGFFNDEELVKILKDSIEDPAGLFGARMVPKALRVVEILGILQARKWQLASLNEFRDFFGLKRHETMEDINPDPKIADILRSLYDHPDMVELYPGLFLEEGKPAMNPGCGGCPPYTVGRAVFSDAVTLVRSDRFYTLDYTAATLTNWGIAEVAQDYKTLGGSMMYKLIQRALPGWFPYNSLHVMQPFFTKKANKQIATEIGTINQYTDKDPAKPVVPTILTRHAQITKVLTDQNAFGVPWLPALNDLFPGKKDYGAYMLSGDAQANTQQRNLVGDLMYGPPGFKELLSAFVVESAEGYLNAERFRVGGNKINDPTEQIDIIRDIAIPVNTHMLASLFNLDLKSNDNPLGTLSIAELYKHLLNVRIWGFNNNDPGMAWRRRAWATEGAVVLTKTTKEVIDAIGNNGNRWGLFGWLLGWKTRAHQAKEGSLGWYGRQIAKELMAAGKSPSETADIMWLTALAGVGVPVGVFTEVMKLFLDKGNESIWKEVQGFASQKSIQADQKLREYVLEAQRLTSTQRNLRICKKPVTVDGQDFKPGQPVVCLMGNAGKDKTVVEDPDTFKPGRPRNAYIHFGYGPHECLGREVALTYIINMVKVCAKLKNLRRAPGPMGLCKYITVGTERCYLNDSWSYLTFDPTTWKLHFDGEGQGVHYSQHAGAYSPEYDLDAIKRQIYKLHKANDGKIGKDGALIERQSSSSSVDVVTVEKGYSSHSLDTYEAVHSEVSRFESTNFVTTSTSGMLR
ncbi:heme peroxidase [Myriangium duriaei CBS 260.36]|uniref:linoleate 8R-lipoxygenase n=1 Tax=Myriangium duriaei CBS 260.36 TaxID=1168546 RepID=A0A9P4IXI1_9PEZI|nr:heme peroxidase [Myriangium duriaei CBS 260.36]